MDTLSGVTDRLFNTWLLFDIRLLADKLLSLDPSELADFLLDLERGRGTGTLLLTTTTKCHEIDL